MSSSFRPFIIASHVLHAPPVQQVKGSLSAYERLRESVSSYECTAHDTLTNQSAFINEINHKSKLSLVDQTLYPITHELHIHPCIPESTWETNISRKDIVHNWSSCIERYAPL